MNKEKINGDEFTILHTYNIDKQKWNILEAGRNLILTLPSSIPIESVNKIMSDYDDDSWGTYVMKLTKRRCIAIRNNDVEKLVNIINMYI